MKKLAPAFLLLSIALPEAAAAQDAAHEFQALEQTLFTAGTRLATANAPFCDDVQQTAGFMLHDAAAYGEPAAIRASLGLTGDIAIQAVAPGSLADAAGIAQNDTVVTLDGRKVAETWPATDPGWQRAEALRSYVAAALAAGSLAVEVTKPDGTPLETMLEGMPACASRYEVLDGSDDAWADGERVAFGRKWAAFGYDEHAFAASVAHELAHNILSHVPRLETVDRKRKLVRISERDADRMMPWLLWNAGYDPAGAVRWMSQWGPRFGFLTRKRTHDAWDERVAAIEAEIATMNALIAQEGWQPGEADWKSNFAFELDAALEAEHGG
ncbi:hypothetical protein E3U23_09330 [Erythrobacter litoralis]|uniref:hypothetical protein n=1 Tax=Erythrobacter litoralis TaxID=39960 RepID=UPI00243553A6|nr:hypothetical protein [Erythrobacter litoralis]MDG6079392.1 hypothetical protein [Erythrobacter litoralis]